MAVQIPATQGELDALKVNLTQGFGQIQSQVRARNPQIQAAYDAVAKQIRADAAARTGSDQSTARAQEAGMAAAAQSLGVQPVSLGDGRAKRLSSALSAQYNGDANAWGGYFGTMGKHAQNRNTAAADAFGESGRQMNHELDLSFQEYLAGLASGGGGGGGRGGGRDYDDEELLTFPKVAPMTKGVMQGLAATQRRLTGQGEAYKGAGLLSKDGTKWLGPKLKVSKGSTSKKKSTGPVKFQSNISKLLRDR